MTGVEEQPDLGAARLHQLIYLALDLDHRAHVVMESHGAALGLEPGRKLGELGAVALDRLGRQADSVVDGRADLALHGSRGLGIDDDRAAHGEEEVELAPDALLLLLDRQLEEPAGEPARCQCEALLVQRLAHRAGLARELAALLHPGEAGLAGLGQAGLERDVAAELRQVVVGPADRRDAEPDRHRKALLTRARGGTSSRAAAASMGLLRDRRPTARPASSLSLMVKNQTPSCAPAFLDATGTPNNALSSLQSPDEGRSKGWR